MQKSLNLTIIKREDQDATTLAVSYDARPAYCFTRTDEFTDAASGEQKSGIRVVWAYYRAGQRVATILVARGKDEILPSEANRLRRCWPHRIEIGFTPTIKKVSGRLVRGARAGGVAWLTDGSRDQPKPLVLELYFADEVFVHPEDDELFDASENFTNEDRNWVAARDGEAERRESVEKPTPSLPTEVGKQAAVTKPPLSRAARQKKVKAGMAKGAVQDPGDRAKLVRAYRELCRKHGDRTKNGYMSKKWCAEEVAKGAHWPRPEHNRWNLRNDYPCLTADVIKGLAGEKRKPKT